MTESMEPARRGPGRVTRLVLSALLLAPLAFTASLFVWTEEGRAIAVDSALSLGLGRDVAGTIRYQGCAFYIDGQYPGSKNVDRGTRCEMVIEAEGERAARPIDLDHAEALAAVSQPGRALGRLGAAMPAGILFDRLGRFGTLIVLSLVCLGGLVAILWPRRRAALQQPRALE